MNKFRKWLSLPWAVRWMLTEALFLSGWYRFGMLHRPFPEIAAHLGEPGLETDDESVCAEAVKRVAWAVAVVCRRTPWESKCLVQALTARKMLVRRGISCTLYLGARRTEQGKMQAHAWLRCGSEYVVGGDGSRIYAVTSLYGTQGRQE